MMTVIGAILLLFGLLAIGWNIAVLFDVSSRWEKLGLAFIIGSWLVTVEMMLLYQLLTQFSWQISALAIAGTLVVEGVVLHFCQKLEVVKEDLISFWWKTKKLPDLLQRQVRYFFRLSHFHKVLIIMPLGFLTYTFVSNWIWPVSDWDAIALYDFRAQLIRVTGNWLEGKALGYFYHYPPFTSLWHGLFYQVGFERVKVLYTLLFSSFLVVTYHFLRRRTTELKAWIGIFLLTFAPLIWGHVMVAYTNLPYTIYYCLAVFYAINWVETKNKGSFGLSLLLLAGATWVRQSEPFWVLVLGLLVFGAFPSRRLKTWLMIGIGFILYAVFFKYWPWYTASLDLPPPPISVNDALGYSVPINLGTLVHHTFLVTDHVLKSVAQPIQWLLLPTVLVLVLDPAFWRNQTSRLLAGLLAVMGMLIWGGTFYFSFTYKSWHLIGESLTRLTMVTVPFLIAIIAQSTLWQWLETIVGGSRSPLPKKRAVSKRR